MYNNFYIIQINLIHRGNYMLNILMAADIVPGLIGALIGVAVAAPVTYFVIRLLQKSKANKEGVQAKSLLEEAKLQAKNLKKEAVLEAKEETFRLTSECDQELKERRA